MTSDKAIRLILEYASDLPVKQALACHIAAGDVGEVGVEEWIEWSPMFILETFAGIARDSSQESLDRVKAHLLGEQFIDELVQEFIIDNEETETMDVHTTMSNLRDSMLEVFDAVKSYFTIQEIIRVEYYGLH